jgi:hypothetical protein
MREPFSCDVDSEKYFYDLQVFFPIFHESKECQFLNIEAVVSFMTSLKPVFDKEE